MGEQQDAIASFGDAGVLAGIRWAYLSATSRVLDDYSEAAGHDATWAGMTRFTYFRDRLDRVFACGRYAVPAGSDAAISVDLLHAELTERDIATMPQLPTDLVVRADLNGSPGWAWQNWRWLLASCTFGKIDELPWPRKSPTKQRVAQQRNLDPAQGSLFDELADEEVGGLEVLLAAARQLDRETLVVAHSQDVDHDGRELVLGRARLNTGGGKAWHWYQDLLTIPPAEGGRRIDEAPSPTGPNTVLDAPVRLRRPASERPADRTGGDQ
ncbi:MAG: hypothetical protein LC799_07695 [Actinobacteria bacterium]|nr:hypothetical protein [Actinomycetota bacterium]